MNNASKDQHDKTQALIQQLYNRSRTEYLTPSAGDAYAVSRNPHLRLRRTLIPSVNLGLPKYAEAQFMLSKQETSGKRISLEFGVKLGNKKKYFTMDGYAFGASEDSADIRIVTLHGISPGVSRTRWHTLGARYNEISSSLKKKVRFVALDWHSIDKSVDDDDNDEFLTCLPKHIMDVAPNDIEEISQLFAAKERQESFRNLAQAVNNNCPKTFDDGAKILRSIIEEGLGWGKETTQFVLGIKSWSGGLGMRLLAQLVTSSNPRDKVFASNINGAIIMHPASFNKSDIVVTMSSGVIKNSLLCWAKDDPLVPYPVSQIYLNAADSNGNDHVQLVTYESGGHHNFDGTDDLPNFDDKVIEWIDNYL